MLLTRMCMPEFCILGKGFFLLTFKGLLQAAALIRSVEPLVCTVLQMMSQASHVIVSEMGHLCYNSVCIFIYLNYANRL